MADFSVLTKVAPALEIMASQGAFLLTGSPDKPNVMTIGWGTIGDMWGIPVFTAPVRLSRYSHGLLNVGSVFTVSFPNAGEMKKALGICGSKSGRDCDKIQAVGLELLPAKSVISSVVKGCGMYLECRVLSKTDLSLDNLCVSQRERWYSGSDEENTHTLYCSEILACYEE